MKQRLLLALLVLFASVGMVKASTAGNGSVTLTIPKGNTVKITVDNFTGMAVTQNSNQAVFVPAKTFTIQEPENFTGETYTASFYSGVYTKLTIGAGAREIEFGKTTQEEDWSYLKTLTIEKGEIEKLILDRTLQPMLTSLTIQENKILKIPAKKQAMTTYAITAQKPDLTLASSGWATANAGFSPALDQLLGKGHGYSGNFELSAWSGKDAEGKTLSSSTVHQGTKDIITYYFYSGGAEPFQENSCEYVDGEYTCTLTFTDGAWEGAKIAVKVKVLPAKYTMKKPEILPKDAGSLIIQEGSSTKFSENTTEDVTKGTTLTVKVNPSTGYSFSQSGFKYSGLNMTKVEENLYTFKVNGKAQPTLSATFTAEGQPITISQPTNGSFSVWNGDTEIKTGDKVATGTKLTIKATPANGYTLDKFLINNATQQSVSKDGNTSIFEYIVMAGNEATIMSASFKEAELTLKIQWTQNHMKMVQLNDGSETGTADNETYSKTYSIPYGTKPTISFQTNKDYYITSIIANNDPVDFTITKKQEGNNGTSYLITEFDMKNVPVTMIVNTSGKSEANIIVDFKSADDGSFQGEALVYDGTEKKIPYLTSPNNLAGVIAEYFKEGETVSSVKGYIDADDYKVKFSRPADDVFAGAKVVNKSGNEKTDGTITFTIKPATPIITSDPKVTIDKTTGKYTVTPGVAQYVRGTGKQTISSDLCVWEVVSSDNIEGNAIEETSSEKGENGYPSEVVTVRLHIKAKSGDWDKTNNSNSNFYQTASVSVKAVGQTDELTTVNVYVLEKLMPEGTKLTLKNGNKQLGTSATVLSDTHISFDIDPGRYTTSDFGIFQVDKQGNKVSTDASDIYTTGIKATGTEMYFLFIPNKELEDLIELELISAKDESSEHVYNGNVQTFKTEVIQVKNKVTGDPITAANLWSNAIITYKDATGKETTTPINAGTYTVTIKREADNTYKAFTATGTMLVQQAEPTIVEWPNDSEDDPAYIGKGNTLSTAVFTGGVANVAGQFEFISPNTVVEVDGSYDVKFVSQDPNYKDVSSSAQSIKAYVKITNETILSIAKDDSYTITAKDANGKTYASGATVPVGTTLTFTVTPAATYKLKTLYVNGTAISGNTYKTTAGPISVKAEMTQEFTITVTKPTRGAVVTLPSNNKVQAGESYSFTVAALAADMSKIVVKDGSTTITGTDGKYTISNIAADKSITITLDNPTAITFTADTTLSPAEKPMGAITFTGLTDDNKCYYGDKVTVTATPVSGTKFVGWSGRTETTQTLSITATDANYKFKALYSGSPTGIETIEGVKIYGSKGNIVINCDSDATVTIISMNGQSKKVTISGDTRIPASAGIYGVVLEKGGEVLRTKVMVR